MRSKNLAQTKSISEAENHHGLHTAAKSEISGHTCSNYTKLLNSRTNEYVNFTKLLQTNPIAVGCFCFVGQPQI